MKRIIGRLGLIVALALAGIGAAAVPAQADDWSEMQYNCVQHQANFWTPGHHYEYNPNGSSVIVERTGSFQVAGSSSACEDINIGGAPGYALRISNIYARTYMCSLSNPSNCWFNSWRWCGGGCAVATNMSAGVWYFVEIANLQYPGNTGYVILYD
jgi:hypothetical protein